jgi:hypothetical protein
VRASMAGGQQRNEETMGNKSQPLTVALVADAMALPLPVSLVHPRPHFALTADSRRCLGRCLLRRRWAGGGGGARRRNATAAAPATAAGGGCEAAPHRRRRTGRKPLGVLQGTLAGATCHQRGWARQCARHAAFRKRLRVRLASLTGAKCWRHQCAAAADHKETAGKEE